MGNTTVKEETYDYANKSSYEQSGYTTDGAAARAAVDSSHIPPISTSKDDESMQ